MLSQKNITHIFVGKDAALATGARSAMSVGQIGIFKNGASTASTTALVATDKFKVVLKDVDGKFIESPFIDASQITASSTDYAAATEQKVYVGYNGTTGSITVANDEVYVIHMNMQDGSRTWGEHPLFKLVAAYQSDASATQTEIADALVLNASKNFEKEAALGVDYVAVSRINAGAVTAANDFVNAIKVVKGSNVLVGAAKVTLTGTSGTANVTGVGGLTKLVTFDTDLTTTATNFVTAHAAAYLAVGITLTSSTTSLIFTPTLADQYFADPVITNATGDQAGTVFTSFEYATNTDAVVGDYLRLGATSTTACALTSNIYKITAISGNTMTLDIPVVEATATIAAGSAYNEVVPSATAIAAAWGLGFTAKALAFEVGMKKYAKLNFQVQLGEGFASTLLTTNTTATKGEGTYEQVAENEWFLKGNRGANYRVADWPVSNTLNATSGTTYDCINVDFTNDNATDISSKVLSFGSLLIYTAVTQANDALKTVFGL